MEHYAPGKRKGASIHSIEAPIFSLIFAAVVLLTLPIP
jgi:hypothetical protein